MWNNSSLTFIGCDAPYDEARDVIFGAPFDSTTSYRPGARFGCRAIRNESYGIETYSPYLQKDLAEDSRVCDIGDLEICIGDAETALGQIEKTAGEIFRDGKRPILLGGEHLVTLGSLRAAVKTYPELHIIHFDAHADLRDDYLGARLSHATVMRRAWELLGDGRIHQFGIRSGDKTEFAFAKNHTNLRLFDFSALPETVKTLRNFACPVYFSLDLDVLDPSAFPGTGTPEAGGVSFPDLLGAIGLLSPLTIVGMDMVELAPNLDQSGVSTAAACKLFREILLTL